MPDLRVRRTLVKSPPELWAELSEVEGLERHLGEFGEITITRAEPETTVAWEGENASGTVELEPTGWGTKVTITAAVVEAELVEAEVVDSEVDLGPESPVASPQAPASDAEGPVLVESDGPFDPEPDPFDPEPVPEPKSRGFVARWLFRERRGAAPAHTAHRLDEFPEQPEPQLPAWSAQAQPASRTEPPPEAGPLPQAGPLVGQEPSTDVSYATGDADFEFDFATTRRSGEDHGAEESPLEPMAPERAKEVLETALENLGQAHHRPFSRG